MKPLPRLPKPGTIADVRQSMKAAPALPAVEDGSGIGKFFGIWPGDETDKQLLAAIDEIRKPDDKDAIIGQQLSAEDRLLKEVMLHAVTKFELKQAAETIRQLREEVTALLTGKPLADGTWPHLLHCNGSRAFPAGTRGITCCCHPLNPEAETIRQMTELLREYRYDRFDIRHGFCGTRVAGLVNLIEIDERCSLCIKADLLLKETK